MKDINDIMLNPIRMRIIQAAVASHNITATNICKKMADIPRTTVYRHIKILIENNILSIVSEKKIRGSMERTLAFNSQEIASHNSIEQATQNAFAFLMNRYTRFERFFKSEKADPAKERIFLNNTIFMATDEEFDNLLIELQALFQKYDLEYAQNRKPRDISIISAPSDIDEAHESE